MIVKYNDEEIFLCTELDEGEVDSQELLDDTLDLTETLENINGSDE